MKNNDKNTRGIMDIQEALSHLLRGECIYRDDQFCGKKCFKLTKIDDKTVLLSKYSGSHDVCVEENLVGLYMDSSYSINYCEEE